jgi:hypothetical protein
VKRISGDDMPQRDECCKNSCAREYKRLSWTQFCDCLLNVRPK